MAKERFEILKSDGYYFRLIAPDNENIGYNTGFETKEACIQGISDVRAFSQHIYYFTYWQNSVNHLWYFNLHRGNNQGVIILRSEGYTSKRDCLNAVGRVRKYAPTAAIVDKT